MSKNKTLDDILIERIESFDWDNTDDRFTLYPGMTLQEIKDKTKEMARIAREEK